MQLRKYILFAIYLFVWTSLQAQFDPSVISRIEDGKIVLQLDFRWTEAQKSEVQELFNLDSTLWKNLKPDASEVILDSIKWEVKRLSQFMFELSKKIDNNPISHFNENDVFLIGENYLFAPGFVDQDKVFYGANQFKYNSGFVYGDGKAQFYLPGYLKAKQVFISGSFNNWSLFQMPLQKVDTGWVATFPLFPGKYFYKYITDGKWITDPGNRLTEDDGAGNTNSVVYCPNFLFRLKGYPDASDVVLTGTFNSWNRKELKMHRSSGGWELPLYLKNGTYSYKFLVEGKWITDPSATKTRTDGAGNLNSVIGLGDEYVFRLSGFTSANRVILASNFNNWNTNELLMDKTAVGWQLSYNLAPGNYEYKFIVDGKWIGDPVNPYKSGSGDFMNSLLSFKANHTFTLSGFQEAGNVIVTGTFNNWNTEGYRMVKQDGKWTFPVYLSSGKHLYKFIVDGKWILDPSNKLWEENEFGNGNSVLWQE